MFEAAPHQVTLTLHGLERDNRDVDGAVFASKIRDLISALSAADKHANQRKRHRYVIVGLNIGSAELTLAERRVTSRRNVTSSIPAFLGAIEAVYRNNEAAFRQFNGLGSKISKFCIGAGKTFAYAEITSKDLNNPILIDQRVALQAQRLLAKQMHGAQPTDMYRGQVEDAYDGAIKELDVRGRIPKGKLVLSGGRTEIDCVFPNMPISELRAMVNQRAWVKGIAIYDGTSALPGRVEVYEVRPIIAGSRLLQWEGAVTQSETEPEWGGWLDG